MKATGRRARALWSMPLFVEGRAVGVLGMGFYERRKFSPEDRVLVDTVAKQCARALARAIRVEREETREPGWLPRSEALEMRSFDRHGRPGAL
jgi:GAF domain-containing protein